MIQKTRTGFLKRICFLQGTQCVMVSVLVQPVSCAHFYFTSPLVTSCVSLVHTPSTPSVITWFNSSIPRLPASTLRVFKSLCSYRLCILSCMTSSFFSPCKLFFGGGGGFYITSFFFPGSKHNTIINSRRLRAYTFKNTARLSRFSPVRQNVWNIPACWQLGCFPKWIARI